MMLKMKGEPLTPVTSFKEASHIYQDRRDDSGEGASTFDFGKVVGSGGKILAHVSYNGRVWAGKAGDKLLYCPSWGEAGGPLVNSVAEA